MLALLLCCSSAAALSVEANPIRKVVTLLQDMQKEIEAEGEKEQEAFDKFMCYCDGSTGDMSNGAKEAAQKIEELQSKLEALKAEKTQLEQELAQHKSDRKQAKDDQQKATSLRNKEKAEFTAQEQDMSKNIAAMEGAIGALEAGRGSFVQMPTDQRARVQKAVQAADNDDFEKQQVLALLEGKAQAGSTDQIIGMLKSMLEEMQGDLSRAQKDEAAAQQGFEELSAAKSSEIAAATKAIESKSQRAGQVAVEVVQTGDDVEDTTADLEETQKFLADLSGQCKSKKAEWAERQALRANEVAAVGEAIKILNDDDSLDLFKKTMSFATTSMQFLQKSTKSAVALRARLAIQSSEDALVRSGTHSTQLALIAAALKTKAVDFSKIISMIDGMVGVLGKEQKDDEEQKKFCDAEFAKADAQNKASHEKLDALASSLDDMHAAVDTLTSEIQALTAEIQALDKTVAEATSTRKADHEAFLTSSAETQAATQLIEKAKNRLVKFYRPNLYKEAPKRELTDEEKILAASGRSDLIATEAPQMIAGTTQTVYAQIRRALAVPPPPPETFGAYQKKDGKSNGVMALMDQMIEDLKSDLTEAKQTEETDQAEYERLMQASQATREANAKSITQKEQDKAQWGEKIAAAQTDQANEEQAVLKLGEYVAGLHGSCDFLVQNFDLRTQARTNEIEGLKNAKAVLSGANFA